MAKYISRRDFLKGTAAGALGAVLAGTHLSAFAEEKGIYTPGTYSATAAGIESDVTVTMTFDANSIKEVLVDVSGETEGIGAAIGDTMVERVLAAQSGEIDAVSGASITSAAVKSAVNACIAQAKGGKRADRDQRPLHLRRMARGSSGNRRQPDYRDHYL